MNYYRIVKYNPCEKKKEADLKVIVHTEFKIGWKCTLPQAIQEVDEFVSSSEQIWKNIALHHLLTNGSSAVNGCRQNESPNSW